MASSKAKLQADLTTGFGINSNQSGGRFYRSDGRPNIVKRGVGFFDRYSWYHTLLSMPKAKFILFLFGIFIFINLVFACIYYAIGVEHLAGIQRGPLAKNFMETFFFSTQTFTTVGYGRISPTGFLTSAISTLEAFLGLLSFALATGLFYGRFSRPQAYLRFSDFAIIAPYKEGIALMLRTAPFRNNFLVEGEAKLMVAMHVDEDEKTINRFFPLALEFSKVNAIALNWTIVHPINEESPIYGMTLDNMKAAKVEIIVMIKAFDEAYSNTVVTRTSYLASEIIYGARFQPMYHPNETSSVTVLDLDRISAIEKTDLPVISPATV
jgi:inward rectifier potassium channel